MRTTPGEQKVPPASRGAALRYLVLIGLQRFQYHRVPLRDGLSALIAGFADLHAADPKLQRFLAQVGQLPGCAD